MTSAQYYRGNISFFGHTYLFSDDNALCGFPLNWLQGGCKGPVQFQGFPGVFQTLKITLVRHPINDFNVYYFGFLLHYHYQLVTSLHSSNPMLFHLYSKPPSLFRTFNRSIVLLVDQKFTGITVQTAFLPFPFAIQG